MRSARYRHSRAGGNPRRRASALANTGIPVLPVTSNAEELAAAILRDGLLPAGAVDDALHLAPPVAHRVDFLLTWNCRHLANAELLRPRERWLAGRNLPVPMVCTPDELLEKPDAP